MDAMESNALQQFTLLAKSVKGAACCSLIGQALDHPNVWVFAELLDMPNVQGLAGTPSASSLELLKLFAHGTWQDYKARAAQLPALTPAQTTKLKKLSVVTLGSQSKSISYGTLMQALEMTGVREVEDLLIETIYDGLLQGKLDQQLSQVEVDFCMGRDIHPDEIMAMCDQLGQWYANSHEVLACISDKLNEYKAERDRARAQQVDLDAKVDAVKVAVRAQQDAQEGPGGDFDAGFDDDIDKIRKSGRAKGKHALGVGPRK